MLLFSPYPLDQAKWMTVRESSAVLWLCVSVTVYMRCVYVCVVALHGHCVHIKKTKGHSEQHLSGHEEDQDPWLQLGLEVMSTPFTMCTRQPKHARY